MSYRDIIDLDHDELDDLVAAAHRRWGHTEELLAMILEAISGLHNSFIKANSDPKKSVRLPKPYRYPRPHEKTPKRTVVRMGDLAQRLGGK